MHCILPRRQQPRGQRVPQASGMDRPAEAKAAQRLGAGFSVSDHAPRRCAEWRVSGERASGPFMLAAHRARHPNRRLAGAARAEARPRARHAWCGAKLRHACYPRHAARVGGVDLMGSSIQQGRAGPAYQIIKTGRMVRGSCDQSQAPALRSRRLTGESSRPRGSGGSRGRPAGRIASRPARGAAARAWGHFCPGPRSLMAVPRSRGMRAAQRQRRARRGTAHEAQTSRPGPAGGV